MRLTLKTINDELRRLGHDVHVDKGDGYFYVWKGDANSWLDRTVNVPKVGSLTLEQWGDGFNRLKKLNHQFAPARGARKLRTEIHLQTAPKGAILSQLVAVVGDRQLGSTTDGHEGSTTQQGVGCSCDSSGLYRSRR